VEAAGRLSMLGLASPRAAVLVGMLRAFSGMGGALP
jgi:hypothetical protein